MAFESTTLAKRSFYFLLTICTLLLIRPVTDCTFLDFRKAFDSVSHRLLHKLSKLNLDPTLLKWIEAFLTDRTQYVSANNYNSRTRPVTSGVPQGSVLGPLLFLIYINDLADRVSSSIRLFADDCVIYRKITNSDDSSLLQCDLNNISSWCDNWLMNLNPTKCKYMRISKTSSNLNLPVYSLNSTALDSVLSYKYLGVHISSDLSWHKHTEYITNNANRMLGFLRRNFSLAPVSLKLLLYKTVVRSKLEYASAI